MPLCACTRLFVLWFCRFRENVIKEETYVLGLWYYLDMVNTHRGFLFLCPWILWNCGSIKNARTKLIRCHQQDKYADLLVYGLEYGSTIDMCVVCVFVWQDDGSSFYIHIRVVWAHTWRFSFEFALLNGKTMEYATKLLVLLCKLDVEYVMCEWE